MERVRPKCLERRIHLFFGVKFVVISIRRDTEAGVGGDVVIVYFRLRQLTETAGGVGDKKFAIGKLAPCPTFGSVKAIGLGRPPAF